MWIVGDGKANQACGLKIRDAFFHAWTLFFNEMVKTTLIRHLTINTQHVHIHLSNSEVTMSQLRYKDINASRIVV